MPFQFSSSKLLHTFRLLICILLLCAAGDCYAGLLYGKITDASGESLPFAHVFLQDGSAGSASGIEGDYSLELPDGQHRVFFGYVGYRTLDTLIEVQGETRLDVQLQSESVALGSVVITASEEDPAMAMMRKVIARRDSFHNLIPQYQVDAYIKGLQRVDAAPDKIFGFELASLGVLDSNNAGIVYLSESESTLSVQRANKVRETMHASRVSGDDQAFSWNSAAAMDIEIHQNKLNFEGLSQRPLISPLADNAFFFYRFRLLGSYSEEGYTIHKIEVVPRRAADPVFRGNLYVVDGLWRLQTSDLLLTQEANIDFIDSLIFRISYAPLSSIPHEMLVDSTDLEDADIWMPRSREFRFQFKALGIKGRGYFMAFYQNYDSRPEFPKRYFGLEELNILDSANTRDSSFWASRRPVALSPDEIRDYREKDSIAELRKDRAYLDSLDAIANKPSLGNLITGYRHRNTYQKNSWGIGSPLNLITFNTVEGWSLGLAGSYRKELECARHVEFSPRLRYGTANQFWAADGSVEAGLSAEKFILLRLAGGRQVRQFQKGAVWPTANTLYTLLLEQNDLKLFARDYLSLEYRQEVLNGVTIRIGGTWAGRQSLFNSSTRVWLDREDHVYSSNNPLAPESAEPVFPEHRALTSRLRIGFRPGQKYMTEPDRKFIMESRWPDFILLYRAGWQALGSGLDFHHLSFTIKDDLSLGLFGSTEIRLTAGSFLKADSLSFLDWSHFHGNSTIFQHPQFDRFQVLPPYARATSGDHFEAHLEHHFNGFVINKIPGIRKTRVQLVSGGHALWTDAGWYGEWTIGLEHIFKVFRVDFAAGWGFEEPIYSARIGVGL